MIVFEYEKKNKMFWVKGKAKPCSSKTKIFDYVSRESCKQLPDRGKITIEEVNDEIVR